VKETMSASAKKQFNIGLAGLGFMASTHIKAYRQLPNAIIHAVCNPSGRNLDGDLSKVMGNVGSPDPVRLDMSQVKATRRFEELLDDPSVDVVDICTPTYTHVEMALAALKAGQHVICEKPLARSFAEAKAIADAAETSQGMFMPAMCIRFWPEWAWLKQAIDQERYGKILSARFRRVAEPPGWGQAHFGSGEKSGGALLDLHIHDTDFVQCCFGRPLAVYSQGYSKTTGAIDHVVTQYTTRSGAIVHAEGTWAMTPGFGFNMAFTANFERATADYDISRPAGEALKLYEQGEPPKAIKPDGADGYVGELAYFLGCIERGVRPSVVTARDGASAVEICEAEEASVKSGQLVALS
jgi:predicted dehydrogenase